MNEELIIRLRAEGIGNLDQLKGKIREVNAELGKAPIHSKQWQQLSTDVKGLKDAQAALKVASESTGAAMMKSYFQTGEQLRRTALPAVMSFNQVIQDAPFGISGVANNIQMLTQQFVYLRMQAGGSAAALAAMGGSLVGPAGILFAISVVTSALVMFANRQDEVKKKTEDVAEKLKKETDALNDFTKAVDSYNKRFGGSDGSRKAATEEEIRLAKARLDATNDYINALKTGEVVVFDNVNRTRMEVTAYTDQMERLKGRTVEQANVIKKEWQDALNVVRAAKNEVTTEETKDKKDATKDYLDWEEDMLQASLARQRGQRLAQLYNQRNESRRNVIKMVEDEESVLTASMNRAAKSGTSAFASSFSRGVTSAIFGGERESETDKRLAQISADKQKRALKKDLDERRITYEEYSLRIKQIDDSMVSRAITGFTVIGSAFSSMAEGIIQEMLRMAAQWAALSFVKFPFPSFGAGQTVVEMMTGGGSGGGKGGAAGGDNSTLQSARSGRGGRDENGPNKIVQAINSLRLQVDNGSLYVASQRGKISTAKKYIGINRS